MVSRGSSTSIELTNSMLLYLDDSSSFDVSVQTAQLIRWSALKQCSVRVQLESFNDISIGTSQIRIGATNSVLLDDALVTIDRASLSGRSLWLTIATQIFH